MRSPALLLVAATLLGPSTAAAAPPDPTAFAANDLIGRGINWDNTFIGGGEPWTQARENPASYEQVTRMADAGFDSVRLQTRFDNAGNGAWGSAFTIDPDFLADVREKVEWVLEHDMVAIIDVHYFYDLMYRNWRDERQPFERTLDEKFVEIWRELAEAFKDLPAEKVVFDLINEPHANNDDPTKSWQPFHDDNPDRNRNVLDLQNRAREVIRGTGGNNATRTLMYAPTKYNSPWHVLQRHPDDAPFVLPDDPHLILTLHYYGPNGFTHVAYVGEDKKKWSLEGIDTATWTGGDADDIRRSLEAEGLGRDYDNIVQ